MIMTKRTITLTLSLALTASACGEILRTPDLAVGPSTTVGQAIDYEISAFKVTPDIVQRANAMPFVAQVTIDGAGAGPASRVSAEQAIKINLPVLNRRPAYALGAGDIIQVFRAINVVDGNGLGAEQAVVSSIRVGEDGYVDLLDAGRVFVGGKSVSQAEEAIATAYGARSKNDASLVSEVEFPAGGDAAYKLGAGDVLSVSFIISSATLTGDVSNTVVTSSSPIGPDGVATFLQIGPVEVGGLTLSEAQQAVSQVALRGNAATDQVQLNVESYRSQSVIISGEVESSLVSLRPGVMSFDKILAASGLLVSQDADYLVNLERGSNRYQMRASTILNGANQGRFIAQDGDRIEIRRLSATPDFRVTVVGFNAHKVTFLDVGAGVPAVLALTDEGLDLRTLLLSRGVKATRDLDAVVRLIRNNVEYSGSARDILIENPTRKIWLTPNDSIIVEPLEYVPSQAVIVGQVGAPKPFPIDQAARSTVSQALFSAGLFSTPSADFKHIYVVRQQDGANYDAYHFDLSEVLNLGLADQMELRPGDLIFVRTNPVVKFSTFVDVLLGLDSRISEVQSRL